MLNNTVIRTVAVAAMAVALAGCGVNANTAATQKAATEAAALKKKAEDGKRQAPPTANKPGEQPKQGFAARESARIADRALSRYSDLTRDWERAWSDSEKDRIEQRMLDTLNRALKDVQTETSANGHDEQDRRAYDIADQGLDRYDRLFREWQMAWSASEKRRIINDMLSGMVRTLQDVQRN